MVLTSLATDPDVSDYSFELLKKSDSQYFASMLYGYLIRHKQAKKLIYQHYRDREWLLGRIYRRFPIGEK